MALALVMAAMVVLVAALEVMVVVPVKQATQKRLQFSTFHLSCIVVFSFLAPFFQLEGKLKKKLFISFGLHRVLCNVPFVSVIIKR